MKTKLKLHLLLLTLLSLAGLAHAQGTAIGYQGRLNDGGGPATGLYDFNFNVFGAEVGGGALAGTVVRNAVPTTNGVFNVSLDFGAGVFTGAARWLDISVRTNGVGALSLLAPRTPLLPTPYALFASKAGGVADGTVTADQLNTGGVAPAPGQFLSYRGGNFAWTDPGVAVGDVWSVLNNNAYYNAGNVGIGTSTPANPLTLRTGPNTYGLEHTDGTVRLATFLGGSVGGGWLGTISNDKLSFFVNNGGARMTVDTTGNVGIGTATPASKLTVFTPSGGITRVGMEHTDGTIRLGTYVASGLGGLLGTVSAHPLSFFYNNNFAYPNMTIGDGFVSMVSGPGFVTVGTPNGESGTSIKRGDNRADVRFDGSTLKLVAGPGFGPPSSLNGLAVSTAGNVGIGTADPQVKLDVRGSGVLESTIWSSNERAILSLNSTLAGQNRIWTLESGVFGTPGLFGIYDRTAGRARLTIDTAGVVNVGVLRITGGADLAEPFQMKEEELAKGSVVVIDDEHPGRLKRSQSAYDTHVAGIISGANGINPGIALHQDGAVEGGQNVALSGRVYVQADAAFGAIKPGDLLTTSDTPGHAMKVTEHGKAQGAILGKAMSELKAGKGMVLVLVTLQ